MSIIVGQTPHKPNAPTKLSATASSIQVQWTSPLDGGSPILGYIVYQNGIRISDVASTIKTFEVTSGIVAGLTY